MSYCKTRRGGREYEETVDTVSKSHLDVLIPYQRTVSIRGSSPFHPFTILVVDAFKV